MNAKMQIKLWLTEMRNKLTVMTLLRKREKLQIISQNTLFPRETIECNRVVTI